VAGNTFGKLFRITTFGESHGEMLGVVIDGCPAGLEIDLNFINKELARRRPGQSKITTQRKESDEAHFISGIFEGKTTGTPITALIKNEGARSKDYSHLVEAYRPSHADYTYDAKYGHRDHRGGGRASARETAARVLAGSVAKLFLKKQKIEVSAFVSQVGEVKLLKRYDELDLSKTDSHIVRCPDKNTADEMQKLIELVRREGDTVGGLVTGVITGVPPGLGEPVFDKLHAELGKAMLSINAVKGFEYGSGFDSTRLRGSEHNDLFTQVGKKIRTTTNFSGGIQGGISNGMDIYFKVAFKPVATIMQSQKSITSQGKKAVLEGKGRHDPCVLPRAVPIVEAMAALTIADYFLLQRVSRV
jgi:chorismate synthase